MRARALRQRIALTRISARQEAAHLAFIDFEMLRAGTAFHFGHRRRRSALPKQRRLRARRKASQYAEYHFALPGCLAASRHADARRGIASRHVSVGGLICQESIAAGL